MKFIKDWRFWMAVTTIFYVLTGLYGKPWMLIFGMIPTFATCQLHQYRAGGAVDQIRRGKILADPYIDQTTKK